MAVVPLTISSSQNGFGWVDWPDWVSLMPPPSAFPCLAYLIPSILARARPDSFWLPDRSIRAPSTSPIQNVRCHPKSASGLSTERERPNKTRLLLFEAGARKRRMDKRRGVVGRASKRLLRIRILAIGDRNSYGKTETYPLTTGAAVIRMRRRRWWR